LSEPVAVRAGAPLEDLIDEGRRLVDAATQNGLTVRLLGGVAVYLQSPPAGPLLPRAIGDIDIVTRRGSRTALTRLLTEAGYTADAMFNALHGAHRLAFVDEANRRKLDVFIEEFSMCHDIPIAGRLDRDPYTIPLAELLLTKLQIVQLNERDQRDIYSLTYEHPMANGREPGVDASFIAEICARDWGLWRTVKATIQRCREDVAGYDIDLKASTLIRERLAALWDRIEQEPKSAKWRLRSRVGDRMRWYDEPEENL
jgi:hypothetical protein